MENGEVPYHIKNTMATLQTNIITRTPEEMNALREKHRYNLALLEANRAGLVHITKLRQPVRAATLYNWVKEGKAVIAPWNREEVRNREGDENEWNESLATKVAPGQFIAYWVGKVGKEKKINPTKECPLVIYEGGHRTRWTMKVFSGEATYCGMTYSELQDLAPETATEIAEVVIDVTIAVSQDREELEAFAKKEYETVNTNGERLKAGEVIRAKTDEVRADLEESLQSVLQRDVKAKKRDAHLEDLRALVHGAAGLLGKMDKNKGSLIGVESLTQEQQNRAQENIREFGEVEAAIAALPELAGKDPKKRIRSRKLDLPFDGTLMYALQGAVGPAGRAKVRDDWVELHRRFFADKAEWKAKLAFLKRPTNNRRSYEREPPFPIRWRWLQTMLHQVEAVAVEEHVEENTVM